MTKIEQAIARMQPVVFFPQTEDEAAFIQIQLFKLGVEWRAHKDKVINTFECAEKGIAVAGGYLYYNPSSETLKDATVNNNIYTSRDFAVPYIPAPPSPPPLTLESLLEKFNTLAAQMQTLANDVATIKAELAPRQLNKLPTGKKR